MKQDHVLIKIIIGCPARHRTRTLTPPTVALRRTTTPTQSPARRHPALQMPHHQLRLLRLQTTRPRPANRPRRRPQSSPGKVPATKTTPRRPQILRRPALMMRTTRDCRPAGRCRWRPMDASSLSTIICAKRRGWTRERDGPVRCRTRAASRRTIWARCPKDGRSVSIRTDGFSLSITVSWFVAFVLYRETNANIRFFRHSNHSVGGSTVVEPEHSWSGCAVFTGLQTEVRVLQESTPETGNLLVFYWTQREMSSYYSQSQLHLRLILFITSIKSPSIWTL